MHSLTIIGPPGSGKSTAASFLATFGYTKISAGDLTRELCIKKGIEPSRNNLIEIGELILEQSNEDYFTNLLLKKAIHNQNTVFEGIRLIKTIRFIRETQNNKIIFIETDYNKRFHRLKQRDHITMEDFVLIENGKLEKQTFAAKEIADITLINNSSKADLKEQLIAIIHGYKND